MSKYQKQCPIDGGTCGQGGTCPICENEALGSELIAAKTRIAELEKALEPFAQAYKVYEPYNPVNAALASVSMEHLRRAAELLEGE